MKNILLLFILICSSSSHAMREHKIWICRLSAESNSNYGALVDTKLQILKEKIDKSPKNESQQLVKKFIAEHEAFKDLKYKQIRDFTDNRVRNGDVDVITSDADRQILEAGIDSAYGFAGENFKNESLGKSKEHYYRKIFDDCLKELK